MDEFVQIQFRRVTEEMRTLGLDPDDHSQIRRYIEGMVEQVQKGGA
jgi:hypothetical protein